MLTVTHLLCLSPVNWIGLEQAARHGLKGPLMNNHESTKVLQVYKCICQAGGRLYTQAGVVFGILE